MRAGRQYERPHANPESVDRGRDLDGTGRLVVGRRLQGQYDLFVQQHLRRRRRSGRREQRRVGQQRRRRQQLGRGKCELPVPDHAERRLRRRRDRLRTAGRLLDLGAVLLWRACGRGRRIRPRRIRWFGRADADMHARRLLHGLVALVLELATLLGRSGLLLRVPGVRGRSVGWAGRCICGVRRADDLRRRMRRRVCLGRHGPLPALCFLLRVPERPVVHPRHLHDVLCRHGRRASRRPHESPGPDESPGLRRRRRRLTRSNPPFPCMRAPAVEGSPRETDDA
jgi:hypothetical protein